MDSPYRITNQEMLNIFRSILMCNKEKTVGEIFVLARGKQHPYHVDDPAQVCLFEKLVDESNGWGLVVQGLRLNDDVDLIVSLLTDYWAESPGLTCVS